MDFRQSKTTENILATLRATKQTIKIGKKKRYYENRLRTRRISFTTIVKNNAHSNLHSNALCNSIEYRVTVRKKKCYIKMIIELFANNNGYKRYEYR